MKTHFLKLGVIVVLSIFSADFGFGDPVHLSLGNLEPFGAVEEAVFDLAVDKLWQDQVLPKETTFEYHGLPGCVDPKNGIHNDPGSAVGLRNNFSVNVIFGSGCSEGMEPTGKLAAFWDIPVVCFLATKEVFMDKTIFPTLARVSITMDEMSKAIGEFMLYHEWKRCALVWNSSHAQSNRFADGIRAIFPGRKIHISADIDLAAEGLDYAALMEDIRLSARVVIVGLTYNFQESRDFMLRAHSANVTGSAYVYLTPWLLKTGTGQQLPWEMGDGNDTKVKEAFQQTFIHVVEGQDDDTVYKFWRTLENKTMTDMRFNTSIERSVIPQLLITKFDAVYLYGLAVNACLAVNGCNWMSGKDIFQGFRHKQFHGASGDVVLDGNAGRIPGFFVQALSDSGKFEKFYRQAVQPKGTEIFRKMEVLQRFMWKTNNGKPPADAPSCGFRGELCPEQSVSYAAMILMFAAATVILVCGLLMAVYWQRKNSFEKALLAKSWLITSSDLVPLKTSTSASVRYLGSLGDPGLSSAAVGPSHDSSIDEQDKAGVSQVYSLGFQRMTSISRGQPVAVKAYSRIGSEELSVKHREDLLLLKSLKELQHSNLNPFLGICLSHGSKNRILVAWNFCQKGSLSDILFNEEIELDTTFRASILRDIVEGLQYLHQSPIGVHGSLSANNCLIDKQWTVRLTDFGVNKILIDWMKHAEIAPTQIASGENLYHLAPELLRTFKNHVVHEQPTQNCDIYSFGMVMYQVLFRDSLFDIDIVTPEEILEQLKVGGTNPIRPVVPNDHKYDGELIQLMKCCWEEVPDYRPNIRRTRHVIFTTFSAFSSSVVDHMIRMMGSYAVNLEEMVTSRTKQLYEERQRSDELLSRLLPKSVGEKLKSGQDVPAETFDSVTVFFSDIVRFEETCAASKPIEIIQMLNDLYTLFDSTISLHDAYKQMSTFKPVHIPNRPFSVRVGIHSGPVAAGVVGIAMPRYCLFGDTVNVASRMETTSEANKIQISEVTKEILASNGSHHQMKYRGKTLIKGKGLMDTYWLEQ